MLEAEFEQKVNMVSTTDLKGGSHSSELNKST